MLMTTSSISLLYNSRVAVEVLEYCLKAVRVWLMAQKLEIHDAGTESYALNGVALPPARMSSWECSRGFPKGLVSSFPKGYNIQFLYTRVDF